MIITVTATHGPGVEAHAILARGPTKPASCLSRGKDIQRGSAADPGPGGDCGPGKGQGLGP